MAHPAGGLGRKTAKQRRSLVQFDGCLPILACWSVFNGPSKQSGHQLGSITDTKDRYPDFKNGCVADRGRGGVNAGVHELDVR
jgi:hypothetical protein